MHSCAKRSSAVAVALALICLLVGAVHAGTASATGGAAVPFTFAQSQYSISDFPMAQRPFYQATVPRVDSGVHDARGRAHEARERRVVQLSRRCGGIRHR